MRTCGYLLRLSVYPMPTKGFHLTKSIITLFDEGMRDIKIYLKMRAFQGCIAAHCREISQIHLNSCESMPDKSKCAVAPGL